MDNNLIILVSNVNCSSPEIEKMHPCTKLIFIIKKKYSNLKSKNLKTDNNLIILISNIDFTSPETAEMHPCTKLNIYNKIKK